MNYMTECSVCGGGTNNPKGPCVGHHHPAPPASAPSRCPLCGYQYGHQIGCENNPVDIALRAPATVASEAQSGIDILSRPFEMNMSNYGPDDVDTLHAWALDAYDVIKALRAQLAERDAECSEDDALREKMSGILTRTADALKGKPAALTLHSWHDLPEVAASLSEQLAASEARVGVLEKESTEALRLLRNFCPIQAEVILFHALSQPKGDSNEQAK